MEQLLQKQSMTLMNAVLDATQDYVLGGDFILPEYCPDVAVVLKCLIKPYVQSRRFNGNVLTVDGTAVVRVLYLDEERRCVREAEFSQPINCSLHGQNECDRALPIVDVAVDYVNCRAVSPRRIEVRSGLTVSARAYAAQTAELPARSADERLFTKGVQKTVATPLVETEKIVTVNELLDFDSALPAAEQLLGGDCTAVVNDCKLLNDKAIVKGQIYLHQLYTDDCTAGSTYVLDYTVPFSLIMDVDGACDGLLHAASVALLSDTEECVGGSRGPNTALEFTAKLLVQLHVYQTTQANFILDAYHADYPVTLGKQEISLRSPVGALRQSVSLQKSVALPETELKEIVDTWVLPQTVVGRQENGHAQIDVQVIVCMLVRDAEGTVAYFERPEELRVDCPMALPTAVNESDCELNAFVAVQDVNYAALGDKLELRLTLSVSATLWECVKQCVVGDITLHPDEAYPSDRAAMRLYYAQPGESVWNIARACHTSVDAVCEENELGEDILVKKAVLLIPTC
ncbi:MAG: DUF3794 domain-containing protein [Clostridia bacterium]|nr:DUF3794 domain-containing protein [Clostridia bacterium]